MPGGSENEAVAETGTDVDLPPPVRRHYFWAGMLCAVLALAAVATAAWIRERESGFRLFAIERGLIAAEAHAARLFAFADAILLPALWGLDGRAPESLSAEQPAAIARGALETVPGRFALDFWTVAGAGIGEGAAFSAAGRDFHDAHAGPGRDAPGRGLAVDPRRDLYISLPQPHPRGETASIFVSRAIRAADGTLRGVASVAIPLHEFTDVFTAVLERPGDRIALWRNDARPLVRAPAGPDDDGELPTPPWDLYPLQSNGRLETDGPAGRGARLTVYGGLGPLPLVLAYATEWRALTWQAMRAYWPLAAVALAAFLAALVYAVLSLRYAEALYRANLDLGRARERLRAESEGRVLFIANMNHELRTPLNAIVGFGQILAGAMFGPLGHPKYAEYARDIVDGGKHLLALVGDIIDYSSIELGNRRLEPVSLDASATAADLVRLLRPVAAERAVTLHAEGGPVQVRADPVAVRQILINLVSNAIKFSPPGGRVVLAAAPPGPDGRPGLAVSDEGPGIADDEIAAVGRPFFRTRAARIASVSGTGLGLSISTALARRMGGALQIECPAGRGTRVTLRLPAAPGGS